MPLLLKQPTLLNLVGVHQLYVPRVVLHLGPYFINLSAKLQQPQIQLQNAPLQLLRTQVRNHEERVRLRGLQIRRLFVGDSEQFLLDRVRAKAVKLDVRRLAARTVR